MTGAAAAPAVSVGTVPAWPVRRLGAASAFGLALPAAAATAGQMYAPRGVWTDGTTVVATDTGNHRVLIWHQIPDTDGAPADVILGQPDRTGDGPAASGRGPERGLRLPAGVGVIGGRLVVADAWHHRLLIWDQLPHSDDVAPDAVLGQDSLSEVAENRGGEPDLRSFRQPFGFGLAGGVFWVCDTYNRRVLGWSGGLPEPGQDADVLLGQDGPADAAENRGAGVGAATFRWPHAVAGDARALYVADAGNHRVLGWQPPPAADAAADLVLGQPGFDQARELAYRPQGPGRLRFSYGVAGTADRLAVADTANNRVLLWRGLPGIGAGAAADAVLGQPDFDSHGENRWEAVADDSLCWPYGLCLAGDLLAIADSGNNRVVLWRLAGDSTESEGS